jgi:hypothetical protein
MKIWHIANKGWTKIILLRTNENTFQLIQVGEFQPLLTNPNYTLIDKKYLALFSQFPEQVVLQEVSLIHKNSNTCNNDYCELKIMNTLILNVSESDDDEVKIWTYEGELFVSDDLKNKIIAIDKKAFKFNLGFSNVA